MKRITSTLVILFIMLFAINVKANSIHDIYSTIYKGDNTSELYNLMPTEVEKGEIVSVRIMVHGVYDWTINYGSSVISWDDTFELVETNGKYYTVKDNNIREFSLEIAGENRVHINYLYNGRVTTNDIYVAELKFKVKESAKDGVYRIKQEYLDNALAMEVSGSTSGFEMVKSFDKTLQYQVGKSKVTSNYTKEDIELDNRDVYVIGNHMFTRDGSSEYDGTLTTEYIMLASKSIDSDEKSNMIIYLKDAFGDWKNGINNKNIENELPDNFKISYIDMIPNYAESGIYTDNNEATILRLLQINDKESIVTIETSQEIVHGIATMNGRIATLTSSGKSYRISVTDTSATITTSDSIIGNKTLTKRTNNSINNYFNRAYSDGVYDGYGSPIHYLKSAHTGKYTHGNYELNVLRVGENNARICLKTKGATSCAIDYYIQNNEGSNRYLGNEDSTYALALGDASYGFNWSNNQIGIICLEGNCNSNYIGTYSKDEKLLTLEDCLHLWEKNEIKYGVTFNPNNGDESMVLFVSSGTRLVDAEDWSSFYSYHDKDGYVFNYWKQDNNEYDFENAVVNSPITLVADYIKLPGTSVLSIASQNSEHDYHSYANDMFEYYLSIELSDSYDGFDIFEVNGLDTPVSSAIYGNHAIVEVVTNSIKLYFAKPYLIINNEKHYGENSNTIEIHPVKYTVTFDSNGGSQIASVDVPYNGKLEEPQDEPLRTGYSFVEWQYNGDPFDFENHIITEPITLVATWENDIATPVLPVPPASYTNDYYVHKLWLTNQNRSDPEVNDGYCTNVSDPCNMGENDNYYITGYEIYEVVGNNKVRVEINNKTQFAPNEYVELTTEPKTIKRYVARAYVKEGAETAYSDYSSEYVVDNTLPAPTIAFNPNYGTLNPTNEVENWIEVTNLMSGFGHMCAITTCTDYKVYQFELYNKVGDTYNAITTFGPTGAVNITANYGDELHLYVRGYVQNGSNPIYTDYSNELVLNTSVPAPNIGLSHTETGNVEYDNTHYKPFVYANGDGYIVDFYIDSGISNYEFFEKNSNVALTTITSSGGISIIIPEGSNKTIVARNYVEREGNQRIYSTDSNEITINLTNPTYTFETVTSQNDSTKVNVIAYINNHELSLQGIIVNDTLYDDYGTGNETGYITVDSSVLENIDEIILGIDQISAIDPNHFTVEVNATRKTN